MGGVHDARIPSGPGHATVPTIASRVVLGLSEVSLQGLLSHSPSTSVDTSCPKPEGGDFTLISPQRPLRSQSEPMGCPWARFRNKLTSKASTLKPKAQHPCLQPQPTFIEALITLWKSQPAASRGDEHVLLPAERTVVASRGRR